MFDDNRLLLVGWTFACKELRSMYGRSFMGLLWTIVPPAAMAVLYWFVLSYGLRVPAVGDKPYVAWFLPGLAAWMLIAESVSGCVGAVNANRRLLITLRLPAAAFPLARCLRAGMVHLGCLIAMAIALTAVGFGPTWAWLQLPYLLVASGAFLLGLGIVLSHLAAFNQDVEHLVTIGLQFAFWGTPVFWSISALPSGLEPWFSLNPLYHLVEGYRRTFIDGRAIWDHTGMLAFWAWTVSIWFLAVLCVRRLGPLLSDES